VDRSFSLTLIDKRSLLNDEEWNEWIDANARAFDYHIYPCVGNLDDENADCKWWDLSCEQAAELKAQKLIRLDITGAC
jgi:hypothetical protein